MKASIMADQQEVALAVDLDAMVCTEQLWADRFHWSVHANASDITFESHSDAQHRGASFN